MGISGAAGPALPTRECGAARPQPRHVHCPVTQPSFILPPGPWLWLQETLSTGRKAVVSSQAASQQGTALSQGLSCDCRGLCSTWVLQDQPSVWRKECSFESWLCGVRQGPYLLGASPHLSHSQLTSPSQVARGRFFGEGGCGGRWEATEHWRCPLPSPEVPPSPFLRVKGPGPRS